MKKAFLIIVAATTILAACTKTVPGGDAAVGTYNGIFAWSATNDTPSTCLVTKINDNLINLHTTPVGGPFIFLGADSITITGNTSPYTLSKLGVPEFTGSLNNNTLTWSVVITPTTLSFTGTK